MPRTRSACYVFGLVAWPIHFPCHSPVQFQALCLAWPQMGRQRPFRSHAIACTQFSCGLSVSAFYQGRVAFHVYGDYWAESTHVKRISISHPFFFF